MSRLGYVYVLVHPVWRGMVKIGKTTRSPQQRGAEICSVSGLLAPCTVAWCCQVSDLDRVEAAVHQRLGRYRVTRRREMFRVDVETARAAIEAASQVRFSAPIQIHPRRRRRSWSMGPRRSFVGRTYVTLIVLAAAVVWVALH